MRSKEGGDKEERKRKGKMKDNLCLGFLML